MENNTCVLNHEVWSTLTALPPDQRVSAANQFTSESEREHAHISSNRLSMIGDGWPLSACSAASQWRLSKHPKYSDNQRGAKHVLQEMKTPHLTLMSLCVASNTAQAVVENRNVVEKSICCTLRSISRQHVCAVWIHKEAFWCWSSFRGQPLARWRL